MHEDPSEPEDEEIETDDLLTGVPDGSYASISSGPIDEPVYDAPSLQMLNDIAMDESRPAIYRFIQTARITRAAKTRLSVILAAFLSKNQVFSNIENLRDFQMAQDDIKYVQMVSRLDYTQFDLTADYHTGMALMESNVNLRLRRSRKALNLRQVNTQRSENVSEQVVREEADDKRLRSKIPFLGGFSQ
jgi:hypothetical protein